MKQVFRLMGLPDKIIAFDELPADLVKGFELCRAEAFPRYWKNWMGEMEVVHKIPSELNPVTGQRRHFDDFIEKDSFFYLVDWNVKPVVDKWRSIEEYVRQKVSSDFRLTDKLEDMAKALAPDKTSGITLEPDDVVVIPIPKETPTLIVDNKTEPKQAIAKERIAKPVPANILKCEEPGCSVEFEGSYAKNSMRWHIQKKHKKEPQIAST